MKLELCSPTERYRKPGPQLCTWSTWSTLFWAGWVSMLMRSVSISKSSPQPFGGSIVQTMRWISQNVGTLDTWWLIPLSKWVITPVINGTSRVNPLITGVITHLLSGMNHLVEVFRKGLYRIRWKLVETSWNLLESMGFYTSTVCQFAGGFLFIRFPVGWGAFDYGATPIAGWFRSWKIHPENGGYSPAWLRKPPLIGWKLQHTILHLT